MANNPILEDEASLDLLDESEDDDDESEDEEESDPVSLESDESEDWEFFWRMMMMKWFVDLDIGICHL